MSENVILKHSSEAGYSEESQVGGIFGQPHLEGFPYNGKKGPIIPAFVADFAAGQYVGGFIRKQFAKQKRVPLTSWLAADIIKLMRP